MCFYYALSQDAQRLKNRYQLKFEFEFEMLADIESNPKFYVNGFQYPQMPVITNAQPRQIRTLNWGLIPSWVKTKTEAIEMRSFTLNARSETAFSKPSFRKSIRSRRCLVPADGFYEWRLFKNKKYPHYIYLKSKDIFSFAGIWDEWTDTSTGEIFKTYSILTTDANPLLEKIHNTKKRMPVILPKDKEMIWLNDDLTGEEVIALMKPFDEDLMDAHTISKLITSRTEDPNTPELQKYYHYKELDETSTAS